HRLATRRAVDEADGPTPSVDAPPRPTSARLLGIDAARAVALVGMFATHIMALRDAAGAPTPTGLLADGRASALFAVLAGVGIALSTGGPRRLPDARAHLGAAVALVVRGLLIAVIGLALVELGSYVAVILMYYGLLFAVAAPLLRLGPAVLAAGAVLACALTPVLSIWLRMDGPPGTGRQPSLTALPPPGRLFEILAVTGYYPVLTWTTYLLAGMAVGRLALRSTRVAAWLLVGGTALAVAAAAASALLLGPGGGAAVLGRRLDEHRYGTTPTDTWWWLAVDAPHSGAPLDLATTTGSALAVIGLMLLAARWSRGLVWVPAAVGAIPLTLYTLHVTALAVVPASYGDVPDPSGDLRLWLVHLLAATVLGVALAAGGLRGPLESGISRLSRAIRRAIAPPPAGPGEG
ncbi:heparan-alpha-glucosaminide N-acetyltransferase domain-containing protein, partial [Pseudonocardia lacus]|uniref:heparan-alpha-glucosaminide N-acetyltransferase domain-containing protein n=1 Tax=Pseudonocardia lacus TaxID=2835865 RepID=UPI001BDBE414